MKKRIATIIFTVISFVIISSYSVYAEMIILRICLQVIGSTIQGEEQRLLSKMKMANIWF